MDSLARMNDVISYIEENLTAGIDYSRIARIACCPAHQFQRIFAFITDMTLADYIRKRRLSLAALELRQTAKPVIDVAFEYGYDTHASFSRAFREQHGVSPSAARSGDAVLNILPRMSFHAPLKLDPNLNYRIEKGSMKMASVSKIEFLPFGPYRVVGKDLRTKPMAQNIPAFWGQCFTDGTYDRLLEMKEWIPDDIGNDYIALLHDFDGRDNSFSYLVGMFLKPGAPVPGGFASYDVSACTMAKAWVEGEEYELFSNAYALTLAAMKEHGYAADWESFFQCEVYTDERFGVPKSRGEKVLTLDYYMPCRKK